MAYQSYIAQLSAIVRATSFQSASSYSWFGLPCTLFAPDLIAVMSQDEIRKTVLYSLKELLYRQFYTRGVATDAYTHRRHGAAGKNAEFIGALSNANKGKGYFEGGWKVFSRTFTETDYVRNGLRARAFNDDMSSGVFRESGGGVRVLRPKESLVMYSGYYVAFSDIEFSDITSSRLLRTYWNLTRGGAIRFVELVTRKINKMNLPYLIKVLVSDVDGNRCDSTILYVRKKDYNSLLPVFAQVHDEVIFEVGESIPSLTKRIAFGVGLAENPDDLDSFGQHRCGILAEGLLDGYENGRVDTGERVSAVVKALQKHGVRIDYPYLEATSTDNYPCLASNIDLGKKGENNDCNLSDHAFSDLSLKTSINIAQEIVKRAIWHSASCNWVGRGSRVREDGVKITLQSLGPDLYEGTSGIALFLGELYVLCGDERFKNTALGAISHAITTTPRLAAASQIGAYFGYAGVALAVARLAEVFESERLFGWLGDALKSVNCFDCQFYNGPDLCSGRAGMILVLCRLVKFSDSGHAVEVALSLGEGLLNSAIWSEDGVSWQAESKSAQRSSIGMLHGNSGIALALLELYCLTQESSFLYVAIEALRFESIFLHRVRGRNAGDIFDGSGQVHCGDYLSSSLSAYWCCGSPGIILSRMRAGEITENEMFYEEARREVVESYNSVASALRRKRSDFTLCHGVTGSAEAIRLATVKHNDILQGKAMIWRDVGQYGFSEFSELSSFWPGAADVVATPGLMTGLSGIGHFYLGLYKNSGKSILTLDIFD